MSVMTAALPAFVPAGRQVESRNAAQGTLERAGNVARIGPGQGVLLDIEAELNYWRGVFPTTEFRDASLPFEDFIPTIKFGYDCFLLFHRQPLAEILPGLRDRYGKTVARHQQLDWRWADQIVRHAWGRMRAT